MLTSTRRVCHITTVHHAFDTRIFYKECRTLAQAGYEVKLIAPSDRDIEVDRVSIVALRPPKGRWERLTVTLLEAYRVAKRLDADVYHFHDPELMVLGIWLKLTGKRVVFDVHEDFVSDVLTKQWIPRWARWPVSKGVGLLQRISAPLCDRIVAATPSIARNFPPEKTEVVQNFPVLEDVDVESPPYRMRDPLVVYAGSLTARRGILEAVQAIALVPAHLRARLTFAGRVDEPDLMSKLVVTPGWERVQYIGWLSRAEVIQLYNRARVGVVLFHPGPNHTEAQPNKLFEYMYAGLPVVVSNFPLWESLIRRHRCGIAVDPLDPGEVANAIQWLLENPDEAEAMGQRGREAVRRHYNWQREGVRLLEVYKTLLPDGGVRSQQG